MSFEELETLQQHKQAIREQAHANRRDQPDKDELSRLICETFVALPEYAAARTVMFYLDVRTEVRTRHYLPTALEHGKRIVVPYCVDGELELFHLENMDELAVGMYKILEPRSELRSLAGQAGRRAGARPGHGSRRGLRSPRRPDGARQGLLRQAAGARPADTPLVALAFECQLFPEIPMQAHDIFMDKIITEQAVYPGQGRRAG